MPGIRDLLPPQTMRKLGGLLLRARYVVEGARAGQHASPTKGASVEFADYREYVKGDNLRNLDWKVFGRTERHYVKQFEAETNLRVNIIIDGSASMRFRSAGKLTKYEYACRLAAATGYLATRQSDSLGLAIYDDGVREQIAPRSGGRHLQLFLERMVAHVPGGSTDTGRALHTLAEKLHRRGLIILLADLLDEPDAIFRSLAHFRKKMHDVIVLQILDPAELDLPFDRPVQFVDMETGEKIDLDPSAARSDYRKAMLSFLDTCRDRCASMSIDYRLVRTTDDFGDFLQRYLVERRRRSR